MDTSTRLPGHGLQAEGKAFEGGDEPRRKSGSYSNFGFGLCSCGARSPLLYSDGARKRWHRDVHKPAVRATLRHKDTENTEESGVTEYRIDYTITRRQEGEEDFTEIGFGSSGAWESVNAAEYAMGSDIENRQWETTEGQPDPEDVDKEPADA
jgi:hypothetical protein